VFVKQKYGYYVQKDINPLKCSAILLTTACNCDVKFQRFLICSNLQKMIGDLCL